MINKFLSVALAGIIATGLHFSSWEPDFDRAKKTATEKNELILLNFSGSDWCLPCMRLKKEIFDDGDFEKMADSTLVLVNADFPRNKKNQLTKPVLKQNEALADRYNPAGKFPLTLLLDANGNIIKSWDGFPNESAAQFAAQIKSIADGRK
jgi:thioredoxin-related protein